MYSIHFYGKDICPECLLKIDKIKQDKRLLFVCFMADYGVHLTERWSRMTKWFFWRMQSSFVPWPSPTQRNKLKVSMSQATMSRSNIILTKMWEGWEATTMGLNCHVYRREMYFCAEQEQVLNGTFSWTYKEILLFHDTLMSESSKLAALRKLGWGKLYSWKSQSHFALQSNIGGGR